MTRIRIGTHDSGAAVHLVLDETTSPVRITGDNAGRLHAAITAACPAVSVSARGAAVTAEMAARVEQIVDERTQMLADVGAQSLGEYREGHPHLWPSYPVFGDVIVAASDPGDAAAERLLHAFEHGRSVGVYGICTGFDDDDDVFVTRITASGDGTAHMDHDWNPIARVEDFLLR